MGYVIVFVVFICICVAVSAAASSEEEKTAKEAGAQRPEAFKKLMAEEFPGFSDHFTYAKCEEAIKQFEVVWKSGVIRQKTKLFDAATWKDEHSERQGAAIFASSIAPIFSPAFAVYARDNSLEFLAGLNRAYKSSITLSKS